MIRKPLQISTLMIAVLAAAVLVFALSFTYFKSEELRRADNKASLYLNTLNDALERYRYLPYILSKDADIVAAASGNGRVAVNHRLENFATKSGLNAVYLMDPTGLTIAASNHREEATFLGQNYGFRPYFQQALKGNRGEFFGVGATTSQPGYFIAEPVIGNTGTPLGVIAVKIDLRELTRIWNASGENVFVTNEDGIVLLSSNADWLYRSMGEVPAGRLSEIRDSRQFGTQDLRSLDWQAGGNDEATIDGTTYLYHSAAVPNLDWNLHFLADESVVWWRASASVFGLAIFATLFFAVALFLRSERLGAALATSQADREQMRQANVELERQIEERRTAERRLERTRSELARANKLAVLGQLSASVTHELGQPISAMRNYLAAAEHDSDRSEWGKTLQRLDAIAARMEHITKQLKFFARPGDDRLDAVDIGDVLTGSRIIMMPALQTSDVELAIDMPEKPIHVRGDRMRLEQVLVNLIRNAISAIADGQTRKVAISVLETDRQVTIAVEDSGSGIGDRTIEQLQEPFHTTQPSGEGMGLGLAISAAIIREHNGSMSAGNRTEGGARFSITLPLAGEMADA